MVLGFSVVLVAAGSNTLLQSWVRDDMRGRVMVIFSMAFLGIVPLGHLAMGSLTHPVGIRPALVVFGGWRSARGSCTGNGCVRWRWGRRGAGRGLAVLGRKRAVEVLQFLIGSWAMNSVPTRSERHRKSRKQHQKVPCRRGWQDQQSRFSDAAALLLCA